MAALCRKVLSRTARTTNLIKKKGSSSINPFIFFPLKMLQAQTEKSAPAHFIDVNLIVSFALQLPDMSISLEIQAYQDARKCDHKEQKSCA